MIKASISLVFGTVANVAMMIATADRRSRNASVAMQSIRMALRLAELGWRQERDA
jgi:hypothetical protein